MTSVSDLDDDLLAHCLSFAGRSGLATAAMTCRRWAELAESDSLWQRVLSAEDTWQGLEFAESTLPGALPPNCPSRAVEAEAGDAQGKDPRKVQRQPWPRVMRQRHEARPVVVIDAGSGYCKFGLSSEDGPSGRLATFLEFGSMESPLLPRIHTLFKTIFTGLGVDPAQHAVIITESLHRLNESESSRAVAARLELREAVYSVLFNRLHVPAVLSINQAALALFQSRRVNGIVVNVGFKTTTVVPIVRGQVLPQGVGVEVLNVAATRVTGCMHHLMEYSGVPCHNMFTIRALKERLCFVSHDGKDFNLASEVGTGYKAETYHVPDEEGGGVFTLGPQRFMAPEVLFNPMLFGLPYKGIHDAVHNSMVRCRKLLVLLRQLSDISAQTDSLCSGASARLPSDSQQKEAGGGGGATATVAATATGTGTATGTAAATAQTKEGAPGAWNCDLDGRNGDQGVDADLAHRDTFADVRWEDLQEALDNVVVTGGTGSIPGFAERLRVELVKLLPEEQGQRLRVHPNVDGYDGPWKGGKLIAESSALMGSWSLTREEYRSDSAGAHDDLALTVRLKLRQ